jgi:hypothetical protein
MWARIEWIFTRLPPIRDVCYPLIKSKRARSQWLGLFYESFAFSFDLFVGLAEDVGGEAVHMTGSIGYDL